LVLIDFWGSSPEFIDILKFVGQLNSCCNNE
jgi:hypothetical protein